MSEPNPMPGFGRPPNEPGTPEGVSPFGVAPTPSPSGSEGGGGGNRTRTILLLAGCAVVALAFALGFAAFVGNSASDSTPAAPTLVVVPDVTGLTQEEAVSSLASVGLVAGRTQLRDSLEARKGSVLAQAPAPGRSLPPGSPVDLVVVGNAKALVPNLVGLTESDAAAVLVDAQLKIGSITSEQSSSPVGTVLSQEVTPGTPVDIGSAISVTVSDGVQLVPDVAGYTQDDARAALEAAGYRVIFERAPSTEASRDKVIQTVPAANQRAVVGSEVTVVLGSGSVAPTAAPVPMPTTSPMPAPPPPPPPPTPTPTPSPITDPLSANCNVPQLEQVVREGFSAEGYRFAGFENYFCKDRWAILEAVAVDGQSKTTVLLILQFRNNSWGMRDNRTVCAAGNTEIPSVLRPYACRA